MTEEKIIRIVRLKRIRSALSFLAISIIFGLAVVISVIHNSADALSIAIGFVVSILSFAGAIWQIRYIISPLRESLFLRSGSAKKAAKLLQSHEDSEKCYEDRYLSISPYAIQSRKDIRQTIDLYDILVAYKDQRSVNTMIATDCVVVIDAWGNQTIFQYRRRDAKKVDKVLDVLKQYCDPELTKFGYTIQAIDWLEQNRMPMPKYNPATKKIESGLEEQPEAEKKEAVSKPKAQAKTKPSKSTNNKKSVSKNSKAKKSSKK